MTPTNDIRGENLAPHDIQAEEATIGSVLVTPAALLEVLPFLRAEDFFIVRHGWIWEALVRLHERHDPIDYLTVVSELEQAGKLAEIGGAADVLGLINKTPSALNVEGYGRIVRRMAWRREVIDYAQRVARLAHSEDTELGQIYSQMTAGLAGLGGGAVRPPRTKDDLDRQLFERLSAAVESGEGRAVLSTGFMMLDRLTGNRYGPGTLTAFGAYTNQGKTQVLVQMSAACARQGTPVLYVTLESSPEDINRRMVAADTMIPETVLYEERVTDEQLKTVLDKAGQWPGWMMVIEQLRAIDEVRDAARSMSLMSDGRPGMIFIDDFDSMAEYQSGGGDYERHKRLATGLLGLPLDTGWGVVCAKQLLIPTDVAGVTNCDALYNRLSPTIGSFEGGRTIVQKGGIVLTMLGEDWIRGKVYGEFAHGSLPPGFIQFKRLKTRHGRSDGVAEAYLKWNATIPCFEDVEVKTADIILDTGRKVYRGGE